jgi:hypothetical protein
MNPGAHLASTGRLASFTVGNVPKDARPGELIYVQGKGVYIFSVNLKWISLHGGAELDLG